VARWKNKHATVQGLGRILIEAILSGVGVCRQKKREHTSIWASGCRVHGHKQCFGATLFPHNIGLGDANDPEADPHRIARVTAPKCVPTGIRAGLSHTHHFAVAVTDRWDALYEKYLGEEPGCFANMQPPWYVVASGVTGKQGPSSDLDHVISTAKHFTGERILRPAGARFRATPQLGENVFAQCCIGLRLTFARYQTRHAVSNGLYYKTFLARCQRMHAN